MFGRVLFILSFLPLMGWAVLGLTPEEQVFLTEHPVIRTQCSYGSPAFEQVKDGYPTGYIIEYLRLLSREAGFSIDFGEGMHVWENTEEAFRNRDLDILTGTVGVERYESYALLSRPYLYFHRVYVVRKDAPDVHSPEDLIGQTVSAIRGLSFVDVWKEKFPGIRLLMVGSDEEALRAVAEGRADATFTLKSTCDYFAARNGFSNLRIGGMEKKAEGLENCFRVAIRSDWPELHGIINKAMDVVPQEELQILWNQWFGTDDSVSRIVFSPEERAYIQAHPLLRYSTLTDAPPLEYCNGQGQCVGLTLDYMKMVAAQTGMRLENIPARSRAEKLENLQSGRCDFLPTFAPYDLSTNDFLCTKAYMTFPLVVATRIDVPFLNTLNSCSGQRVGLVTRIGVLNEYKRKFPGVHFVPCASVGEGLRLLSQGKLFGVIGPQPVVAHQIQELYLGNLKITGTLEDKLRLSAVVPSKDATLRNILDKVFQTVSPEDQERMLNHWISIRFEQGFNYRLVWEVLGGAASVLLLLLIRYRMVARYNRKLKGLNTELAESIKERDRIMSVISHDLRQPVHGYNQMLALLQSGEINPTDEDGQRILTQSRQRGELAIESMENLLNWLNVHRGNRHPVVLSPNRLVEDCRELLAASLANKHLELDNRIGPTLRIQADEQRLAAVLRNLINNAIKFSHAGGRIEVTSDVTADGLRLHVCDYGIGMDAETVRQILAGTPVESARGTEGEQGSGMGLGLCRQFLLGVGSDLEIDSTPGQGCRVSFVLKNQML